MRQSALTMGALVLALTSGAAQPTAADWQPDEAGVTVRAWHSDQRPGPSAHNDRTPGLYALWDLAELRGVKVKALATVLRLSNNRDGVGAGLMAEADITTAASVFASVTAMRGYQDTRYGYVPLPGSYVECLASCAFKNSEDRWLLVPAVGIAAKVPKGTRLLDVDVSGWTARLSVQPKPRVSQPAYWRNRPDARPARSVLLTIGRAW